MSDETGAATVEEARAGLTTDIQLPDSPEAQPRGQDGRFTSPNAGQEAAEADEAGAEDTIEQDPGADQAQDVEDSQPQDTDTAPEGDEPDAVTEAEGEADATAADDESPVKDGMVELEVPENHWLRDKGLDKFPVPIPEEHADAIRGVLADPVRRAEVDEARSAVQQAQEKVQELQTVAQFYARRAIQMAKDPRVTDAYHNIAERDGEEAANRYLAGLMQEDQQALSEKLGEVREKGRAQRVQETAAAFRGAADQDLRERHPDLSAQERQRLIAGFGSLVQVGQIDRLHADEFREYVDSALGSKPGSQEIDVEKLKEEIRNELKQESEAEAERERKRAENPLSGARGATAGSSRTPGNPDEGKSVHEVRSSLRTSPILGVER